MIKRGESKVSEVKAFIGKGSEFDGKLKFNDTVRIDGSFSGQITSSDTLVIGDEAVVKAEIAVGTAIISGRLEGNIIATEKIELHPPARVSGSLKTPALVILEGSFFDGTCQMSNITTEKKAETGLPPLINRLESVG